MKVCFSRTNSPWVGVFLLALVLPRGSDLALGADDEGQESNAAVAEVYFHKNGSVTITVDGQKHLLSPRHYRKQAESLLTGKPDVEIRMEDWSDFERLPSDSGRVFYTAGVRTLTLKPTIDGREETRSIEVKAPLVRRPVAERLIELAAISNQERGRAIWGLSHQQVADDAREPVVTALIEILDDTIDNHARMDALHGLGQLGGPRAEARLRQFIDTESETEADKQEVRELLRKIKSNADR